MGSFLCLINSFFSKSKKLKSVEIISENITEESGRLNRPKTDFCSVEKSVYDKGDILKGLIVQQKGLRL